VELLRNGPRTFDTMISAIDGAQRAVLLENYMILDDAVGQRFSESLIAAARRDVRVQLIADWIGSRETPRAFWRRLRNEGVDVRIFNRPGLTPWLGLLPRDHRKVLVVDDAVGVTGGIGLGEVWSGGMTRRKSAPWRDTAVRIEGPAARDMTQAFEVMWRRAGGDREQRRRRRYLVPPTHGVEIDTDTEPGAVVGIVEGEPLRYRVGRAFQFQAVSAQKRIWIASAYFVPSISEIEALAGAARDGVDVRVLVPSKYDHPWVRRLTRRAYRRLLRNGVRIWEWRGVMMHAKTSVVDNRWVRVGSTDFNPLGVSINYELDALIEDRELGQQACEMFQDDLGNSDEIRERDMEP
jgi:cardiolipin synthase